MTAGLFFCPESQKIRDQDSLEQQEVVSGKYVYAGKKRCAKYQKFILIPDNASWYTAIRSESLIKASYKIGKKLFCLNYILQKYHRSVSNVAMVCVAAVALGSSTYAWFVSNNQVTATTSTISAQSNAPFLKIANKADVADDNAWKNVTTTEDTFNETNVKTLYPAQVVGEFVAGDAEVTDSTAAVADVKFQSAYASNAYSAAERENTRFAVGNPTTAVNGDYAYMESFYIGSTDAELLAS